MQALGGPAAGSRSRRRAAELLELVVEVDARGTRLAHRDAIVVARLSASWVMLLSSARLSATLLTNSTAGPAPAVDARPEVGEIIGGQGVDVERRVGAATDVGRLGARRKGELVREVMSVGTAPGSRSTSVPAGSRFPAEGRVDEVRARQRGV